MDTNGYKERIYIVDDTEVFLKVLSSSLSQYEISTFIDPVTAIEAIINDPPDLVLTDLEMPKIHGIELVRRIRANKPTENTPVIICTSNDTEETHIEAFESGASDFFSKANISKLILNVRVRTLLDRSQKQVEIKELAEEKNIFLRMLCHDLANPLSISIAYGDILRKKMKDPKLDEFVEKLHKGLDKMGEIITFTREHFSIKDKKREIKLEDCDLDYLLRELYFLIGDKLKEKDIKLKVV